MEYNKQVKSRDTIIFGNYDEKRYMGGIARFEGLKLPELIALATEGFLDLQEMQNCAPCIGEFMEFMARYSGYTAHGYVVSANRDDYRVSIEGLEKQAKYIEAKETQVFTELFGQADEFVANGTQNFCWFD